MLYSMCRFNMQRANCAACSFFADAIKFPRYQQIGLALFLEPLPRAKRPPIPARCRGRMVGSVVYVHRCRNSTVYTCLGPFMYQYSSYIHTAVYQYKKNWVGGIEMGKVRSPKLRRSNCTYCTLCITVCTYCTKNLCLSFSGIARKLSFTVNFGSKVGLITYQNLQ